MSTTDSLKLSHLDVECGSTEHLAHLLKASTRLERALLPIHHEYSHSLLAAFESVQHQSLAVSVDLPSMTPSSTSEPTYELAIEHKEESEPQSTGGSIYTAKTNLASSSIWNREGFTPIPESVNQVREVGAPSSPIFVNLNEGSEAHIASEPYPVSPDELLAQEALVDEPLSSNLSETDSEFISIADRLVRSSKSNAESIYEEPDSSIPQPLEALYDDLSPGPQGILEKASSDQSGEGEMPIIPLRVTPPPFDPELHAIVAPTPLSTKRRSPLLLMMMVSIACLLIGGVIAYVFLPELASFMK